MAQEPRSHAQLAADLLDMIKNNPAVRSDMSDLATILTQSSRAHVAHHLSRHLGQRITDADVKAIGEELCRRLHAPGVQQGSEYQTAADLMHVTCTNCTPPPTGPRP